MRALEKEKMQGARIKETKEEEEQEASSRSSSITSGKGTGADSQDPAAAAYGGSASVNPLYLGCFVAVFLAMPQLLQAFSPARRARMDEGAY